MSDYRSMYIPNTEQRGSQGRNANYESFGLKRKRGVAPTGTEDEGPISIRLRGNQNDTNMFPNESSSKIGFNKKSDLFNSPRPHLGGSVKIRNISKSSQLGTRSVERSTSKKVEWVRSLQKVPQTRSLPSGLTWREGLDSRTEASTADDENAIDEHVGPEPKSQSSFDLGAGQNSNRRPNKLLDSARKDLPIWPRRFDIQKSLQEHDILLLTGETGSGKSTQVPQFLVTEPWCKAKDVVIHDSVSKKASKITVGGCIAVTEPRRVAAISLARRVAAEMNTPLGSASPASKVGYSVRFDNSVSPSTQIKFLTEGMLLQELLRDPWLRKYSAVIVDEIHERGVNVDLLTAFLRNLVLGKKSGRGGVSLKLVVMSATADMKSLLSYFTPRRDSRSTERSTGAVLGKSQRAFLPLGGGSGSDKDSTEEHDADSSSVTSTIDSNASWYGFSDSDSVNGVVASGPHLKDPGLGAKVGIHGLGASSRTALNSEEFPDPVGMTTTCAIKGRQYPVQVFYTPAPITDIVDGALRTIFQVHHTEPTPGDILVFLTGQEDIEAVERLTLEYSQQLMPGIPKILVRPLFAALPQHMQQAAFLPVPSKNTRKVILATNVAETSVTVPGVRYVIDCGKAKIKQFRTRLGLDSLLPKPISKSSALQRKGRAGREGPGKCYRLYTEEDYLKLEKTNSPEILRCDVTQTVLSIKAHGIDDLTSFPFLTSPPREALEKALLQLLTLGALHETGVITELGHRMSVLPLAPALAKVLISAADPHHDCLAEVIDIISCLTTENIFLNSNSEEHREAAGTARKELVRREGDHLTLLVTVQKYMAEGIDRRAWAERHFVSHRAMQAVINVRKQLRLLCHRQKLMSTDHEAFESPTPEHAANILRCFLQGFASKTARLCPDSSYKTMVGNHAIAIHPSSGLFGRKVEAILYNEYVYTNKGYAKGVSAIQMDWIGEALGI